MVILQEIQVFLQFISSTAIASSLLYAAVQFRNTRRAQHVANFTKLVELQMSLRRMRVDDPSLGAVHAHDMDGLNSPDEVRAYFINLMQLSVFEIVWFSHKMGQLPDDYFESWMKRMDQIREEPSFQKMLAKPSMKIFHDEFQALVNTRFRTDPSGLANASDYSRT